MDTRALQSHITMRSSMYKHVPLHTANDWQLHPNCSGEPWLAGSRLHCVRPKLTCSKCHAYF